MRKPSEQDFKVNVEGVGAFTFGRRTLNDEMKIQAEYARITEGVDTPTMLLYTMGISIATIRVLMVSAPKDFDLDELDPLEDDTYDKLIAIRKAVTEKEDTFRKKSGKGSKKASAANVKDDGVLVSQEVQPSAD